MGYKMTWPLRPSKTYKPRQPKDSWRRPGYGRQRPYNPYGWHQATDFDIQVNGTIVQTPWRGKIWWKGRYGDLGRVIEVKFYEGPFKGKYGRFCHLLSYTARPIGFIGNAGFAIAKADNTGRSSGNHLHLEIGKYPLRKARFPKFDFFRFAAEAFSSRRWTA